MPDIREKRILAKRLSDHLVDGSSYEWNSENDILDMSIFTAPLDLLTDRIFENCSQYDWDTIEEEIRSELGGDVAQIGSDLSRVEAATADFYIHEIGEDIWSIFWEVQENMMTADLNNEFQFDPIIEELNLQ